MRIHRKTITYLGTAAWAAAVLAIVPEVQAQKGVGGVTGEARLHPGTWGQQRVSRHVRHARDYAGGIYRHARDAGTILSATGREESEELGRSISNAQQELQKVRQEVGQNPAATASLKSIDQHLAKAATEHAMLHKECGKESVDGLACMKYCNQILLELDKAQAEHDALLRTMEIQERQQQ